MRADDTLRRGLGAYLDSVAREIGSDGDRCVFHLDPLAAAFLPLDQHIPWLAERRFALLWDEENGWAAAVTTPGEARLVPVSFLAIDVLADARLVGRFVGEFLSGEYMGSPFPPALRDAAGATTSTPGSRGSPTADSVSLSEAGWLGGG